MAGVIRDAYQEVFSSGGLGESMRLRIQPMECFLRDLKNVEGCDAEVAIEDAIVRGVQEQYLADLCAVWQDAFDNNRLLTQGCKEAYGPVRKPCHSSSLWHRMPFSERGRRRRG